MKKIAIEDVAGGAPPVSTEPAPGDALRELVRFAMRQGYYDSWNKSQDKNVKACPSKVFPTDRKPPLR
jgi:hypothetical protein